MASGLYASTMKAACYFGHGGANIDVVNSFPKPILEDGELLIKVLTASVNPIDIKLHQNNFRESVMPLPKIPGQDFCGVVEELRAPSGRFNVGDRVIGLLASNFESWGTCAEYVKMNESNVVKVPQTMTDEEAASLPMVSTAVVQSFKHFADSCVTLDKQILIQGGAGGVGSFAIQYCTKVLNMKVTTTCSPEHDDFCTSLGAIETINYNKQKFEEVVSGFDAVFDPFSYIYKKRTMNSEVLKPGGWYISLRSSPHSLNVFLRSRKVNSIPETKFFTPLKSQWEGWKEAMGITQFRYFPVNIMPDTTTLPYVMSLVEEGLINPCVDRVFDLQDIKKAHSYVEKGHSKGKVILKIAFPEDDMNLESSGKGTAGAGPILSV